MYDINKLRKELSDSPKQLQLLNILHKQIEQQHYAKHIHIVLPKDVKYSNKLKKTTAHILGFYEVGKKLSYEFDIIRE